MGRPERISLDGRQPRALVDQENAFGTRFIFAEMAFRAEMVSTTRRSALTTIVSISLFRMLAPLSSSDVTAQRLLQHAAYGGKLGSRIAYDMNQHGIGRPVRLL